MGAAARGTQDRERTLDSDLVEDDFRWGGDDDPPPYVID